MCFNSFDTLISDTESALGRNFCFLMHFMRARDIEFQSLRARSPTLLENYFQVKLYSKPVPHALKA